MNPTTETTKSVKPSEPRASANPQQAPGGLVRATGESFAIVIGLFLCAWFLPWWNIIWPGIFAGLLVPHRRYAVARVAILTALVWVGIAMSYDWPTGGRLSSRIASVLSLPGFPLAYLLTGLLAGLLGAFAAAIGFFLFRATRGTTGRTP